MSCARQRAPLASRCRHVVITSLALLDLSASASESGSANSSIGTNIPPAASTAKAQMIQTGEFGAQSSTALPGQSRSDAVHEPNDEHDP